MLPLNLISNNVSVRVHPAVLFEICDAYVRRNSKQNRVIGTLLGYNADGATEIRSCYAVPYMDTPESIDFDIPQHNTMKELYQRVNHREVVVGWFTTGSAANFIGRDVLIHEFYESECQRPVILTLDTTLSEQKMAIAAFVSHHFVSKNLGSGDNAQIATEFVPIACEVQEVEIDRVGGGVLHNGENLGSEVNHLDVAISRLYLALEKAQAYLDGVLNDGSKADNAIGRVIADAVSQVPKIELHEIEKMAGYHSASYMLLSIRAFHDLTIHCSASKNPKIRI